MCLELLRVGVGSRVKRGTKHGVDVADRQAPVPGVPPVANGVLGGAQTPAARNRSRPSVASTDSAK